MTIDDQIRSAISNVGRRRLRSGLAATGVVIGTVTIVLLVSLAAGVRQQINRQFEKVGLDSLTVSSGGQRGGFGPFAPPGPRKQITSADVERWKAMSGIVRVMPEINLPGAADLTLDWGGSTQSIRLSSGTPRPNPMALQKVPEAVAGTLDLSEKGGIIVSQATARGAGIPENSLATAIGQPVVIILRSPRGETENFGMRVVGVSGDNSKTVRISLGDRIAMKSWWLNKPDVVEREGYDSVSIRTEDVGRANDLSAQLRRDGFMVQSVEAFVTVANRVLNVVTLMFLLVGSIALLVATIGIANTMVMAIYERTREIGILKAMGASRGEIRQMFMLEAGFIGMIGGVVGLGIGWMLGLGLNQAIEVYSRSREQPFEGEFFSVTPWLALGSIGFATLIGLLAGWYPARRAAKLDPLQALRHE